MTAATATPTAIPTAAPWATVDFDLDQVLAELRRRFPEVPVWFGEYSGHWWGLVKDRAGQGRDLLVEGVSPAELGRLLAAALQQRAQQQHLRAQIIASRYARGPRAGALVRQVPAPHRHERVGWVRRLLGCLVRRR